MTNIRDLPVDPLMIPLLVSEYEELKRKAAALDWLEARRDPLDPSRYGSGLGALWVKKGQTLLEAIEAAMLTET